MSKYHRKAEKAVDEYLRNCGEPAIMLYSISVIADEAAYKAGKKRELFSSLFSYESILPERARTQWVGNDQGSVLKVINPYHPDAASIPAFHPVAGPFDVAIDMGPGQAPRM